MKLVQRLRERESFFNGWKIEKATYKFQCSHCGSNLNIKFKQMLDAAWGWQERTPDETRKALALIFEIDLTGRNSGSGMDAVVESECAKCKRTTFTFFWFDEYRQSCYDISLRGSAVQESESLHPHDSF
jgi:hypothetical protein